MSKSQDKGGDKSSKKPKQNQDKATAKKVKKSGKKK